MPRYRLVIEYDGTPYVGWQRQENGPSVQGAVEKAILSLTGETVSIRGAGRTDSGVHAMGQVAHADLSRDWQEHTLRNALNAHLAQAGERVAILDAAQVDDGFDARFSALRRHYLYRIISRRAPLALDRGRRAILYALAEHRHHHLVRLRRRQLFIRRAKKRLVRLRPHQQHRAQPPEIELADLPALVKRPVQEFQRHRIEFLQMACALCGAADRGNYCAHDATLFQSKNICD